MSLRDGVESRRPPGEDPALRALGPALGVPHPLGARPNRPAGSLVVPVMPERPQKDGRGPALAARGCPRSVARFTGAPGRSVVPEKPVALGGVW